MKKLKLFGLLTVFLQMPLGTTADESVKPPPALEKAGLVLTFDDRNFEGWLKTIPMFEKYGVKATFFISGPIDAQAVAAARELKQHGHAIAAHSVHHIAAVEYTKTHSVEEYVQREIIPQMKEFKAAGIVPTAFAYPMSNNNAALDAALLKIFRHLRTGRGVPAGKGMAQDDQFFVPVSELPQRGLLYGKGIDFVESGQNASFDMIEKVLNRAAEKREVIVLYAHRIGRMGKGNYISPSGLETVIKMAKKAKLEFYTVDQLP